MLALLLLATTALTARCREPDCPLWFSENTGTGVCYCGNRLGGLIRCHQETGTVEIMLCYSMTYSDITNTTIVGYCLYTCMRENLKCGIFNKLPQSNEEINEEMCSPLNRTGQLCGSCMEGCGTPIYSYTTRCVTCLKEDFVRNLFKYLAVAYLPLTAFYIFVIIFKVSVTSGLMVGYILSSQLATMPTLVRVMTLDANHPLAMWFTLWNLDTFRLITPPFCLHPKATILHVLGLDYLTGVYPLFLIFVTHLAVKLHTRYPIVEKMWRPAYRVFTSIRREWDIQGTLIQAFATFIVLSYVKILNVSFDLLTPVYLLNIEGKKLPQTYLFLNGDIQFFGSEHLPYGILAIVMLTAFNLAPMFLLLLHPCPCFQRRLNKCRLNVDFLHQFLDTFQSCYHHQYRWFAGIYLLVRLIFLVTLSSVKYTTAYSLFGFYFLSLTLTVTLLEPYKENLHNKIDSTCFLIAATGFFIAGIYNYLGPAEPQISARPIFIATMIPLLVLPALYGPIILLVKASPRKSFTLVKRCWRYICSKIKRDDKEDSDEAFIQQLEQERRIT